MSMKKHHKLSGTETPGKWLQLGSTVAGATVAGVGLLVLSGWLFGLDVFKNVLPGLATMKANTALCFLLSGLALVLRERHSLQLTCAGVVCALAGLTLAEYLTGADLGLDQLLFRDTVDPHTLYPGRMVEATVLGFLLSGFSLLLLGTHGRSSCRAQQTLAVCVGMIGVVGVLGYAYDAQQLYRFVGYSSMAPHTAASFVILAIGLIFARPGGPAGVLTASGPAAQLARRLLPVALLVPAFLGWLSSWGLKRGFYGEGMDIALLVLAMMLSLATLVWWTARAVNEADAARREIETQQRNQAELMANAYEPLIVRENGGVILFWNRGAETLYGWPAAEALGKGKQMLFHTEETSLEKMNRQLETTGYWEGELVQTTRDGRRVLVESRQTATRAADGRLLVLESNRDITKRREAEENLRETAAELLAANTELNDSRRAAINLMEDALAARRQAEEAAAALRESEEKLSLALRSAEMGVWRLDLNEQKRHFDDQVCRCLGIDPARFGGTAEEFIAAVHLDDRDSIKTALDRTIGSGAPYEVEYRSVWPDGSIHHVAARGRLTREANGQPNRVDGLVWDVTERRRAEESLQKAHSELALQMEGRIRELREKEVLLKEVHHRVKNNLQVVSSLVDMQADGSEDETVREVLRDVTYRVRSMALVHEKLYHSESLSRIDFAEYAQSLLGYLWRAHGAAAETVKLALELEPVELQVDIATPCGLILNELAGNALKHAFKGRKEGEVAVSLQRKETGAVSFSVKDNGVGLPEGFDWRQTNSLGLRLVQMLAGQLQASVEVDRHSGTEFTVSFRQKSDYIG